MEPPAGDERPHGHGREFAHEVLDELLDAALTPGWHGSLCLEAIIRNGGIQRIERAAKQSLIPGT